MAAKKGGLGRGFDSLFLDNSSDAQAESGSVTLPVGQIEPDRGQPRTKFDEEALAELENSIREFGVLQPLLVRPMSDGSYRIVAGERRWRAARRAGLTEVPVIIRSLTDSEAAAIALIENLQREDLNAIEEAAAIKRLIEEFDFTQEEAADKLSKSRSAIANSLRLLALPNDVMKLVSDGMLSAGHARALLGLNDKEQLSEVANRVLEEGLSVRQTEALCKKPVKIKPEKQPEKQPTFYKMVELALNESMGRKVTVTKSKNKEGGVLQIEFYSDEELTELSNLLHKEQNND